MSSQKLVVLFLFLMVCFAVMPATANGDGDTISVTASGVGEDADAALKDALRAAVKQAAGVLVDAKRLIENDKLVQNTIITFAPGFVQTYKQIGDPQKRADGLVSVQIAAEVKRNELDAQLVKAGVTTKSLDWQGIYAERLTKMQSLDDGIDMLKWIIEEYMLNCITVTAGETRWDQEKRKVVLEIQASVDFEKYSAFVKRFTEVLKKMDVKYDGGNTLQLERATEQAYNLFGSGFNWGTLRPVTKISASSRRVLDENRSFFIATNRWRALPDIGAKKQERFVRYSPPLEVFEEIRNSLIKVRNRSIVVELLDDGNKIVAKDKLSCYCPCYVDRKDDNVAILLFPSLFRTAYSFSIFPGNPEYKEEIDLDIPMDDMRKIRSIQFRYEGDAGSGGAASSSGGSRRPPTTGGGW